MRHSWKQGNGKTKQAQQHEQTAQKKQTAQPTTNNNTQQQTHTCCLFRVFLGLLCSLLTYKGACGIVGNKKNQTKTNTSI